MVNNGLSGLVFVSGNLILRKFVLIIMFDDLSSSTGSHNILEVKAYRTGMLFDKLMQSTVFAIWSTSKFIIEDRVLKVRLPEVSS
jgi:hypothetical protein